MKCLSFITLSLALTLIAGTARSQTCESLFNTSVISKFTMKDQETLTTLARRQVEVTADFSISKIQKQNILKHLDEQVEEFIGNSGLTISQEKLLRQEYRALVFQFKKELSGEIDSQTKIASEKQKALDHQIESFYASQTLPKKYQVSNLNELLHAILWSDFSPERNNDFKLALSITEIDVNAVDLSGRTPLNIAMLKSGDPCFKMLIQNPKLDVNLRTKFEPTAFEKALSEYPNDAAAAISYAKLISSHPSFDPNTNIGPAGWKSLFELAFQAYNSPEIAYLIASHPKFNINGNGWNPSPLHLSFKNPEIVKLLISKGADLNARDSNGSTPLHWIASSDLPSVQSLKLLIEAGADVSAVDKYGSPPLHLHAQSKYSFEFVKLLIAGGADVNARNDKEETALHLAVRGQNIDTVKLLLKVRGINVNIRDAWYQTPLLIAIKDEKDSDNKKKLIKLLKSKVATQ